MGKLVDLSAIAHRPLYLTLSSFSRMQYVQSRMVPKLTPKGFDLVQTPPEIAKKLHDAIAAAVENWDEIPTERNVDVIYNRLGLLPKFVNLRGLEHEVHRALLPMHEAWVGGMKLVPTSIYGVRLYPNGSSLVMHNDKVCLSLSLSVSLPLTFLLSRVRRMWFLPLSILLTSMTMTMSPGRSR
jgi:hypothetical protein